MSALARMFGGAALLLIGASAMAGQTVYRCGNQYSQTPCPEGRVVETTDPRSAAQRAEAKRVAAQERRQAAQMEQERRAQQASASAPGPAGFDSRASATQAAASAPAEHGKHSKKRGKNKRGADDDFVATVPGSKASKK